MAKQKQDIYFGFNKPNVPIQGGGSTRVEKTFTGVYHPVEPIPPLTQAQRETLVAAIRVWLRNRQ